MNKLPKLVSKSSAEAREQAILDFLESNIREVDLDDELKDEYNRGVNWIIAQLKLLIKDKDK